MNVPAEVNGIAPWEPTVATTVAAADLSRPHPSHPHLGGIRVAEEVLDTLDTPQDVYICAARYWSTCSFGFQAAPPPL